MARSGRDELLSTLPSALATAAERRMGELSSQELANTAWAFATAGQEDASLFAASATAAQQRMSNFSPQGLCSTAWAFATAGQMDASLFTAFSTAA